MPLKEIVQNLEFPSRVFFADYFCVNLLLVIYVKFVCLGFLSNYEAEVKVRNTSCCTFKLYCSEEIACCKTNKCDVMLNRYTCMFQRFVMHNRV